METPPEDDQTVILLAGQSDEAKELEREIRERGYDVEYRYSTYSQPMARMGDKIFKGYREIQLAFLF
jgi:hypothetical protein